MSTRPIFEISDAAEFVCAEVQRLRRCYPTVLIAPLFYRIDEGRLYHIQERWSSRSLVKPMKGLPPVRDPDSPPF